MSKLTLAQAKAICEAALAKGAALGLKPLCVVVLDGGGHLIAAQRQDGASNLRPQIAWSKAAGALGLGVSSRKIAEMASERPVFFASLSAVAPPRTHACGWRGPRCRLRWRPGRRRRLQRRHVR